MSEQFSHLSSEELRQELVKNGIPCGPIGTTTRKVYEKRLEKKLADDRKNQVDSSRTSNRETVGSSSASLRSVPQRRSFEAPGRENVFNSSMSARHVSQQSFVAPNREHSFSSSISSQNVSRKSFEGGRFLDDEEDDHMESSRIVSPQRRFTGGRNVVNKKISPIEKFKNVWGYFSRSIGTSTPCSDYTYHNKYPTNKYRRSDNYANFSDVGAKPSFNFSTISDHSRWIVLAAIVVFVTIFSTYIYKVHTETLHSTFVSVKDFFVFAFGYAFFPIMYLCGAVLLFLFFYKVFYWRKNREIQHKEAIIRLVERITDLIYDSGYAGIAEPHVRDMLMPPTKRTNEDYALWLEAARFINNEDSRVRTEIRLINGTECNVWIWIGAGKQRWQGTAVAEGSPSSRVPEAALSRCLKLRGLNFSDNRTDRECLRKELMEKLSVVPKHIDFCNNAISRESVVYLMLKDLNDAKKAFSSLHSQWFDGNIITVKYVKDERYAERFPELK
uniref:LEM domain-containing protein n=1 Tax=Meloidogyne incognita TaxID=6306 RepID=A0A914LF30_MELIC